MSCKINKHVLSKKCNDSKSVCYKNTCVPKKKQISNDTNKYGDVFVLDNKYKMILKVNREPEETINKLSNEVTIQNYVSKYDLAPRIYEYYVESLSKRHKYYIIMENLTEKGYQSLYELYEKTGKQMPDKTIIELKRAIQKLHYIKIAHRDLHSMNIFYNKEQNKIKFIDFGRSVKCKTVENAILLEDWEQLHKVKE